MVLVDNYKTTPRNVLETVLKKVVTPPFLQNVVLPADRVTDEALDTMEFEEPSFMAWIQEDPEIENLFRAHAAAVFRTLQIASSQGLSMEQVMRRIDALSYRLSATVALNATMRERNKEPFSWGGLDAQH